MKGNRNLNLKKYAPAAGAFAIGAAAGAASALLLAPASGKVTRKRLTTKFRSMGRSAVKQLNQSKRLLAKKAVLLKDATAGRLGDTRDWILERIPNGNGKHHAMRPRRIAHR